jgi:hypothetical protein
MTKKDYELIAETIAHHRKQYGGRTDSVITVIIEVLAEAFAEQNERFDRVKFIKACGLEAIR